MFLKSESNFPTTTREKPFRLVWWTASLRLSCSQLKFFHCCFPIFTEPCKPVLLRMILDRVKWWMREGDREERWMMGKDNRALSGEDRPSQTVCFCVLQPQATRLDCNNNNADISLVPLFFLTHMRTHTVTPSQP